MISLDGVLNWFQAFMLTALSIFAIWFVFEHFVWKRQFIKGFMGILLIGFAGVIIGAPEQVIQAGRWAAEMLGWGRG